MSQIQGNGSGSYPLQWQYLQSIQQPSTDPMLQPGAGDPISSFGLDPSAGASGQTQATGSGSGPTSLLSLGTMSALLDAQAQSSSNGLSRDQQRVFGKLDADGDGSISSTELKNAFGTDNTDAANYVMGKLDTNGDGSISTDEFKAGTTRHAGHHHHMHMPQGGSQDAQNGQGAQGGTQGPLAQLLAADGANSSSSSNADGSTTTTITYADGSKVSMTSAASASSDGSTGSSTTGSSQQNLLEQLIKMQAQLIQSMSASASNSASLATI
jgi:EF-hand domain pair